MNDLKKKVDDSILKLDKNILNMMRGEKIFNIFLKKLFIYEITKKINLEKNEIELEINNFCKKNRIYSKRDLKDHIKKNCLTTKDLKYQATLTLKILKFSEMNFKKDLNNYFLKRKELLDEYTFNIIRVKNSDLAYEIYFQLKSGESEFCDLLKKYSFYSDLYPEGIFGPKNLKGINEIIKEKLMNSSQGKFIQPFKVDEWWIILKLIQKKDARIEGEIKKMMLLELFELNLNKLVKNTMEDFQRIR